MKEILALGKVDINKEASWNKHTPLALAMEMCKTEVVRTLMANKNTKLDLVDNGLLSFKP